MREWNDVPVYRKRPARWKAVQYLRGKPLPPDARVDLKGDMYLAGQRILEGDWAVLDLLTCQVVIVDDRVFPFVFERD